MIDMGNQIDEIKENLEGLAEEVKDPNISLEDALDKYSEAIDLSLKATALIEEDSAIAEILHSEFEKGHEEEEESDAPGEAKKA